MYNANEAHTHGEYPSSRDRLRDELALHSLEALPRDILLCITDWLSDPEIICLSLVSHGFKRALAEAIWHKSSIRSVRQEFLHILSRELPQYFVCHVCARLHLVSCLQWPCNVLGERWPCGAIDRQLACWEIDGSTPTALAFTRYSSFNINFAHVQAVAKAAKTGGSSGIPLKALQYLETIEDRNDLYDMRLLSVDPTLCRGRLLVRSQMMYAVPQEKLKIKPLFWISMGVDELCPHLDRSRPYARETLGLSLGHADTGAMMRDRASHRVTRDDCCHTTLACSCCYLDYCMDCVELSDEGYLVFVVTKWQDLGCGLDYNDPAWNCHIDRKAALSSDVLPLAGSIRERFEDNSSSDFVDVGKLTSANMAHILDTDGRLAAMQSKHHSAFWQWAGHNEPCTFYARSIMNRPTTMTADEARSKCHKPVWRTMLQKVHPIMFYIRSLFA